MIDSAYWPIEGPVGATATVSLDLWAKTGSIAMPDGASIPIWGFASTSGGPATLPGARIVANQGDNISLRLHNGLAENISLLIPGLNMVPDAIGAAPGATKTYSFTASRPGSHLYQSG